MFDTRRKAAEERIKELEKRLAEAKEYLDGMARLNADRAVLVSISKERSANVFTFLRNNELIKITTYSTMSDDVAGWKKALFE